MKKGKCWFRIFFMFILMLSVVLIHTYDTFASPEATMKVDPATSSAKQGDTFTVDILIEDVYDLVGWQFNMTWDPSLLRYVNATEGDFLNQWGTMDTYFPPTKFNNTIGFAFVGCINQEHWDVPGFEGATGSGTLATVEFEVLKKGETPLPFSNIKLLNRFLEKMPYTAIDGYFINVGVPEASFTYSPSNPIVGENVTFDASASSDADGYIVSWEWDFGDGTNSSGQVVKHAYLTGGTYTLTLTVTDNATLKGITEEEISVKYEHDVAVDEVTVLPATAAAGDTIEITITVANIGTNVESFDITVYYGNDTAGTLNVVDLAPDESKTLTFSWDTSGVAEGIYDIWVKASPVPGETSVDDNEYVDGDVSITLPEHSFPLLFLIVGVGIVAVAAAAIFFLMRRRASSA